MPEPKVAVFDGGIHPTGENSLFGAVPTFDLTSEPATADGLDHGTAVVGAAMFGLANAETTVRQPPCPIESVRVMPPREIPGDLAGYWILDQIVEAVRENDFGIVNLSIGPERAMEDSHEPDRWTSELDHLAWEHTVLFVVAAGNGGEQPQDLGLHRIQVPGDMVNGITVGACDSPPPSRAWSRADYSSMGPGRHGNRVVPTGVQFGGTDMTLAYLSPVAPSEPTEYTSASIDMVFRPHHQVFRFRPPEGTSPARSVTCDLRTEEARELWQEGWQMSTLPVTKPLTRASDPTEPSLRESGKWETVRHYRFKMAAGAVERPSLELEYLARSGGRLSNHAETIPFALLVSIVDKSPDSQLHDRTRTQFPALRPIPRVRVRVRHERLTT